MKLLAEAKGLTQKYVVDNPGSAVRNGDWVYISKHTEDVK